MRAPHRTDRDHGPREPDPDRIGDQRSIRRLGPRDLALQEAVLDDDTNEAQAEYDRLARMEDALEALREAEWTAYGEAFKVSVLAELEREPIPGLRVPVEFDIDVHPLQPCPTNEDAASGPLARLYDAGWANTPCPVPGFCQRLPQLARHSQHRTPCRTTPAPSASLRRPLRPWAP